MNTDMRCRMSKLGAVACAMTVLAAPITANAQGKMMPKMSGKSGMMDTRAKNADMLIKTLSEEKTEINALAAQQAHFRKMGDPESMRIARLWGVWIREHKAGGPMFMRLIKANGGDPNAAKIMKPPVLGDKAKMLHATHMDHEAAVRTSQMRAMATNDQAIKNAMNKRANLARKHIRQMMPFMKGMDMKGMKMG